MSTEENKVLVRRYWEEMVNQQNLASIDELVSPERAEGLKQFATMMYRAFPDGRVTIDEIIAEGDKVATHWTAKVTHLGDYHTRLFGVIPPTGKQISYTGTTIFRIQDGKIVEDKGNADSLGILHQMGVIPAAGQSRR